MLALVPAVGVRREYEVVERLLEVDILHLQFLENRILIVRPREKVIAIRIHTSPFDYVLCII